MYIFFFVLHPTVEDLVKLSWRSVSHKCGYYVHL